MAAGKHVWQQDVFKINCSKPNGLLRPCLQPSADKNMKQVNNRHEEDLDKNGFHVHRLPCSGKAKKLPPSKRKGCPLEVVGVKLHRKASHVGCACDHGMANKENELTFSDDTRSNYYNDNHGPPVNATDGSKMAGASSKYTDLNELSKDHEAMSQVLFGRSLRLKVALSLWRRNATELVAYLIRIQDTGVLLDCLPVLTNNLQTEAPCLSLGCCVDLMPQVKLILTSKYEEHISVGLLWVQAIVRKWWPELSKKDKRLQDSCTEDRNIEVMKQRLKDLWKEGSKLCAVPGSTGDLAKAIGAYLSQLP
ncbi:KATNB1-like protein 1 [Periophthalmus magnuspinnatus]|uniref:KATNB1-like protein 1 n=1 Tax=Periophthalmus magnuspinnatus TaxID=409849 RepID=UPI00145A0A1D|nr:KATNB1-like protein 1 [Periophthalmus magnuspinnatus]